VGVLRFPIALALAFLVTVGMFGFMRALTNARGEHDETSAVTKIEFVRLRRETEIEEKKREKAEREKPQQAPVTPTLSVAQDEGFDAALDVQALAAGLGAEFGSAGGGGGDGTGMGGLGFNAGLADRAPLPLVRVDPQYPPQAQRRKLEGWVQVRFTISTAGSVKDAAVIKSSDSMFERNAIQAVNKWKYQPQMQAGKPTEAPGQQVVVRFKMKG
jgi:periplasmic protein TonB